MKTNELKKGDIVKLSSGCYAQIMDNKKGNIRLANVDGIYGEEMGNIYVWDIVKLMKRENEDFSFEKIELTPAQEKAREEVKDFEDLLWYKNHSFFFNQNLTGKNQ